MDDDLLELKKGDLFFEYSPSYEVAFEVIEPLTLTTVDGDKTWTMKALSLITNNEITFMWLEKYSHYGPKIYARRAYVCKNSPEISARIKGHPGYIKAKHWSMGDKD